MGSKTLEGSSRVDSLAWDPDSLFVVGRDKRPDGSVDGPEHARWDPRALKDPDPEMVDSFKRHKRNFLTVVVVDVDGVGEIDDGRSRVVAAREAQRQLRLVDPKARVVIYSTLSIRGLSETDHALLGQELNALRSDDDDMTLCEKACHALSFTDEKGVPLTKSRIAKMNGWHPSEVDKAIKIVESASAAVKAALRKGTITRALAFDIAQKPKGEQGEAMGKVEVVAAAAPDKKVTRAAADRGGVRAEIVPGKRTLEKMLAMLERADGAGFVDDDVPNLFLLGAIWALGVDLPETQGEVWDLCSTDESASDRKAAKAILERATTVLKKANAR